MEIFEKEGSVLDLKMLNGWVLLDPDNHYETYQINGRETGILSANTSYIEVDGKNHVVDVSQRNFSVRSTVSAVPSRLNKPDNKFHKLDKGVYSEGKYKGNISDERQIENYSKISSSTSKYGSEVEISIGDRVFSSWMIHHKDPEYRYFFGKMYIMCKYDDLVMTLDESGNPKKMLNGWILFTKEEIKNLTDVDGVVTKTTDSGIYIPIMKSGDMVSRNKNKVLALCELSGNPNSCYKDYPGENDYDGDFVEIGKGSKMIVDIRGARRLEPLNHREMNKEYYIIHRKYILFTDESASKMGLDINKLI